jgi:hypothetical protein
MSFISLSSIAAAAALLCLPRIVAGSFIIYAETVYEPLSGDLPGLSPSPFHFFNSEPSCDDVFHRGYTTYERDDVSGSFDGVRCDGCSGGEGGNKDIKVLEWNTKDYGHYSKMQIPRDPSTFPVVSTLHR